MTEYRKKLIEVALPLDAINAESAREKSIRHGHPSTLHLWWARRPLAACRAVLFAQLVDDPSAHPEQFPTEEEQDVERERLFRIIEDLVKWENSTNEEVLDAARAEISRSCGGNPPPILDPFAGGGSIPLEAQRLGLDAHASDLNPVAVLINKALTEIPPRWAGYPPSHPDADNRTQWRGAEGLAEDVRRYGQWIRDEAERRIGHLYPKASMPDGAKADVIAWIWARTISCPNPACGATMPLASSLWLGKKKGKEAWVNPVAEGSGVHFEIGTDPNGPPDPPKIGRGARFRCLVCGEIADEPYVRKSAGEGGLGAQLMAIAAEGDRQRVYLPPTAEQVSAAAVERPSGAPASQMPDNPRWFSPPMYGMTEHADLFTNRQLVAMTQLSDLVSEARARVERDAADAGRSADDAHAYANSVATYLAFGVDRLTNECSSINTWVPSASKEHVKNAFGRQAIPMTWDFAEANPFASSTGSILESFGRVARVVEDLGCGDRTATVVQADARQVSKMQRAVVATDPPYYDNIGYADLADFFYVWARRSLHETYPELLGTMLTPKSSELIASPYRHGGSRQAAESYFERGFVDVFAGVRDVHLPDWPMTLFYAFKQSESGDEGIASTGWSTMLEGLLSAGWTVTATWPMRTERSVGLKSKDNVLASSVVLACRPRPETAGVTDRQGLVRALQHELPSPVHELQKAHIAPVDLRQAAIGPGMAVFSRFARVIEASGESMRVRTALGLINQVLDEVLEEQQQEFDDETRWAVNWFSQFFLDEGPYGTAEQLAVSMDVSISGLVSSGREDVGGCTGRAWGSITVELFA